MNYPPWTRVQKKTFHCWISRMILVYILSLRKTINNIYLLVVLSLNLKLTSLFFFYPVCMLHRMLFCYGITALSYSLRAFITSVHRSYMPCIFPYTSVCVRHLLFLLQQKIIVLLLPQFHIILFNINSIFAYPFL